LKGVLIVKYTGSCLCGRVTFEIQGDFENFFLCHCGRCRKDTGSAHAANLFSSTAKLRWLSGQNEVKTFNYHSEGHIKSFCAKCGSALPNIQSDGKLLVVPAGCIDSVICMKPQGHIYCASKASWDNDLEKVPKYKELPNE
jgi:hypothetical protein